jgi:hypothetical protein
VVNGVVFAAVVLARLGAPLAIGRFPLPAVLACLVIDAADQTIFERFTTLPLDDYQTYDKALDIYYLALAYISTIRNWGGGPDFVVGSALWYYRLVGVTLFEYTSARWVLFVFPNTFEYYFIALEGYNVRRDPNRLTLRQVVTVAAVIWIVIKLPQEWWIHVAQLDVTDELHGLFGVDPDASWAAAIANRPLVAVGLLALAAVAAFVVARALRRLPPPQWPPTFDSDRQGELVGWRRPSRRLRSVSFFGWTFVEKVVLVSLVAFVFARILPGADDRLPVIMLVATCLIATNTLLSQWLGRRGTTWRNTFTEFAAMAAANAGVALVAAAIIGEGPGRMSLGTSLFLIGLLTLIVLLYDRSYAVFLQRHQQDAAPRAGEGPDERRGRSAALA